ncbi:tRNA nucleotidyltransferase cca2-like isoform X4 [Arachis stenosperma]|uniref:tRNA nucleotidyltransferase cca2-like isoform X4 n=1 Tax=Arachis stenosperma TaxID=217475 RepID=UPI0025ACF850|nr:tRNA nucleotidyltransferase cca2-like isoform X4 [Arachis stenosperma]
MKFTLKIATSHFFLTRFSLLCTPTVTTIPLPLLNYPLPTRTRTITTTTTITTPSFPIYSACAPMTIATQHILQVRDKIELSDIERRIFDRLLATLRHFNLQTQLRVAGGWVRDKLLGKDCYDIDIALDNMMGTEFVDKVREYLLSIGEDAQGVCVIESNPDQSKHLETVRMHLFDMWIDFVNLRSEEYTENSRIPSKQSFGTPEEDAYRRDLTINSLFYNINTGSVEDFTKRGISDLKSGRIVTPLPPKATFLDDPLRLLRAIRFGARFEFTLDEDLKVAAACCDVKDALAAKISRERIGTEVDFMISGNQPVKAMTHICDLTLFWIVFSLPPEFEPTISDGCERLCVAYLDTAWNLLHLLKESTFTDEERRLLLFAALFLPLKNTTYQVKKAKVVPVVNYIIRDSLKRKSKDAEMVLDLHRASQKFLSLIPCLASNEGLQSDDVGWMRRLIDDVSVASRVRVLTGLNKVWEVKPLISGKDVMNVLQLKGGEPLVKEWLEKSMAWQLANPSGTSEECIDWLREANSKRVKLD